MENTKLEKNPPKNPSHVFLGERSINFVLPISMPNIYANISLQITNNAGVMNHINPV
jgi:hypothetical protein